MAKRWPQVIRDPIHDLIAFEDNDCDKLLLDLINAKEMQRLRRIRQLGLSELVFPGANHNRFAHSLGVMQMARLFLNRVERLGGRPFDNSTKALVLAAALVHDVGHGPFSHAFEQTTKDHHEARTWDIIKDEETDIGQRLRRFDATLPNKMGIFFDEEADESPEQAGDMPKYLGSVISSQLDADRFDYLLRDSHATGTGYGRFDALWVVAHLQLDEARKRLYLDKKALLAAEAYVFARYHMYQNVYFHKTTRAAEVMLRLAFRRYRQLLESADGTDARSRVVPGASEVIVTAFSGNKIPLQDYLILDDQAIGEFLKACARAQDPILSALAAGLVNRRLYKCVDATEATSEAPDKHIEFNDKGREWASGKGNGLPLFQPDYLFGVDTPGDTPYKPYDPASDVNATQIIVETSSGGQKELSMLSPPVTELKKKINLIRYYFPAEHRGEVEQLAQSLLRRA